MKIEKLFLWFNNFVLNGIIENIGIKPLEVEIMREFIKKYKKNFLLVLILGFAVYFYILIKQDARPIANKIVHSHFNYLLLVFGLLISYIFLESIVIFLFVRKKAKGLNVLDTFRMNLSTQFFNSITPFAAGGQPFQIFYMNSRGLKTKDSTSIVLMNFITFNIAFVIAGSFCLIYKYAYFTQFIGGYILLIGFGVNVFITVITFILAFSKNIYHVLMEILWVKVIKWPILKRFKLETKTENIRNTIDDFNREIKELNNNKILWIEAVGLHLIRIILYYAIPLFIFIALGESVKGNEVNLIVAAFFVAMVMSYIPTPGASGGAEGLFGILFSVFFIKESYIAALLIWRFLTYYLVLIIGFVALLTLSYKKDLVELNGSSDEIVLVEVR